MKSKICATCKEEHATLFRVQVQKVRSRFLSAQAVVRNAVKRPFTAIEKLGKDTVVRYRQQYLHCISPKKHLSPPKNTSPLRPPEQGEHRTLRRGVEQELEERNCKR